jgi:hypothetical protein
VLSIFLKARISKEKCNLSQTKKESGKNLDFDSYKSPICVTSLKTVRLKRPKPFPLSVYPRLALN